MSIRDKSTASPSGGAWLPSFRWHGKPSTNRPRGNGRTMTRKIAC